MAKRALDNKSGKNSKKKKELPFLSFTKEEIDKIGLLNFDYLFIYGEGTSAIGCIMAPSITRRTEADKFFMRSLIAFKEKTEIFLDEDDEEDNPKTKELEKKCGFKHNMTHDHIYALERWIFDDLVDIKSNDEMVKRMNDIVKPFPGVKDYEEFFSLMTPGGKESDIHANYHGWLIIPNKDLPKVTGRPLVIHRVFSEN